MDDIILQLEGRIRKLAQYCEQLKETNAKLQVSKAQIIRERELLSSKHKDAIIQIESMLSRLKSIEKSE